jgi:hypothetical protein
MFEHRGRSIVKASRWRVWVGLVLALPVGAAIAGAGCNSSDAVPAGAADAQAVCPATLQDTIGGRCAASGLVCSPTFTCGILDVALLCVCDGRTFQCTDGAGNPIATVDALACPGSRAGGSCPATERVAQLAPCTEQGLLCAYPSSCPAKYDPCQCFPGVTAGGGFGLRFECQTAHCGGPDAGIVVDSGIDGDVVTDSSTDADASVDSATDADSAPPIEAGPEAESNTDSPSEAASSGPDAPSE